MDDPWGSDTEPSLAPAPAAPKPPKTSLPDTSLSLNADPGPQSSLPSLRSACLGVIGRHLEELIRAGDTIIPWLPSSDRLSLFAVARRQGWVNEGTWRLFVDEAWSVLDVARTGLMGKEVEEMMGLMPGIRAVDLSDCMLRKETLPQLAQKCPLVEILRLRNVNLSYQECVESLDRLLPSVNSQSTVGESWEDADDVKCSNLANLKYVVWPGIPTRVLSFIHTLTPKVVVVASMADHNNMRLPQWANPGIALDAHYIDDVGPQAWGDMDPGSDGQSTNFSSSDSRGLGLINNNPTAMLPIAERFRLAYVEIEARKAAKSEKNYKQRKRRELRKSSAQQAMASWLDGD